MIDQAKDIISCIGNWYLEEELTYLGLYGEIVAHHLFPNYVLDRLVMGEIRYQTIIHRSIASLAKEGNKRTFIAYGFKIGHYFVKDIRK